MGKINKIFLKKEQKLSKVYLKFASNLQSHFIQKVRMLLEFAINVLFKHIDEVTIC